jgi:hypothetical protein
LWRLAATFVGENLGHIRTSDVLEDVIADEGNRALVEVAGSDVVDQLFLSGLYVQDDLVVMGLMD